LTTCGAVNILGAMTTTGHSVQEPSPRALIDTQAEAARYALLRRLAPSMRHHLVVNLQPIGMIYEVMERRLRAAEPDLANVHESASKINGFARAALNACLDMVTWLAPDDSATTRVEEGVRECLSLLTTSLSFRGYALRNETGPQERLVRRSAMRNVLTATLIHATDQMTPPAELVLGSEGTPDELVLSLRVGASKGEQGFSNEPAYRLLMWSDVQALAAAESVSVTRDGAGVLRIAIPWSAARSQS